MAKPLVSGALWERIRPLLPPPKPRRFRYPGRKPLDDRQALTGIPSVLKTGIPWESLPAEMGCGCGITCWRRLRAWQEQGVWFRLYQLLLRELDGAGATDWARAAADSSFARAFGGVEGSGKNPTDRGRPGVKHRALVDRHGIPLAGVVTPANTPEVKVLPPLVDSAGPLADDTGEPQHRPGEVGADRAHDPEPHRQAPRDRGIEPKLAKRRTPHGSGLGRVRWAVERFFSWLHGFRKLRFVTEKDGDAVRPLPPRPGTHLPPFPLKTHLARASKQGDTAKGKTAVDGIVRSTATSASLVRSVFGFVDECGHADRRGCTGGIRMNVEWIAEPTGPGRRDGEALARVLVHEGTHRWAQTKDVLYKHKSAAWNAKDAWQMTEDGELEKLLVEVWGKYNRRRRHERRHDGGLGGRPEHDRRPQAEPDDRPATPATGRPCI
jgi:transposase